MKMDKINPFFTVDGKKYEIKATRYLLAEFDKLQKATKVDESEDLGMALTFRYSQDLRTASEQLQKAKEEFESDPSDDKKYAIYKRYKEVYNDSYMALLKIEKEHKGSVNSQKLFVDLLEQVVILAIVEQHNKTEQEAKFIWESHVTNIGNDRTIEWLVYMHEELFEKEEVEDPFLKMKREKAERSAERKKGISKVR